MGILGELWVKLGLKNDGFKRGVQDSKKEVSGFAQYMSKLGGMIATAFSVKAVIRFANETAELANRVKGVRAAFEKLGDPSLLDNLRKATQGTVNDLQLMQRAVQAQNFGIPVKNLATYLEFATKRAQQTGQSVDYLVDSIIMGLGRQSTLILDNLGFSAAEIRDRMKEGGTMADAVGDIIKKQMGDSTIAIDNTALATQRLQAAWVNFQTAVGSSTAPILNNLKEFATDYLYTITTILNSGSLSTAEKFGMVFGVGNAGESWQKLLDEQSRKRKNAGIAQSLATERVSGIKDLKEAREELYRLEEEEKRLAGKPEDNVFVMTNKMALQMVKQLIPALEEKKKLEDEERKKKAEELKLKNSLIGGLEEEIKKKEEIRNLSANEAEVQQLNEEIAKMQERLKLLKMTAAEQKKYHEQKLAEKNKERGHVNIDQVQGPYNLLEMQANIKGADAIMDEAYRTWSENTAKLNEEAIAQQAATLEAIEMLNQSISAGITNSLGELANVIAGVEGANIGSVVKALLSPLADAAISAGLLVMGVGKAVEAFNTSLATLQGPIAIAAGAALVAVGVAAKAGLAAIGKGAKGGAGAYGNNSMTSYSGGYGVNTNNYAQATNSYTLTTTLKGQDLLLAIQRTENNNRR